MTATGSAQGASGPDGPRVAVDLEVLAALVDLIGDDGGATRRDLIDTYLADAAPRIDLLMAAVSAGDAGAAGRAAHGLRSSSALIGAEPLAALLLRSETMGRSGAGDLRAVAAEIEVEYGLVAAALGQARLAT